MTVPDPVVPSSLVVHTEELPGGAKWTRVIHRGTTLRIAAPHGSTGISCLFYNAHDPIERYNAADTMKIQWNAYVQKNRLLYSDMGRVLFSITEDTCGAHDTLAGASTSSTNQAKYGGPYFRNTRDNFLIALGRLGLGKQDLMPCLNLFAAVAVGEAGRLEYVPGVVKPGVFIDLRAEMDVLAVLSNTPHAMHPDTNYAPQPVLLTIWQTPPVAADDPCMTASLEARRGFQNTANLYQ